MGKKFEKRWDQLHIINVFSYSQDYYFHTSAHICARIRYLYASTPHTDYRLGGFVCSCSPSSE